MSVTKQLAQDGRGKSKRGPKSRREADSYVFNDVDACEALLALAIGAALQGGALRIGLTRDGGALAVGVYAGAEYGTEYVRPGDDLEAELREIAMAWSLQFAIYDDVAGRWTLP
jgi:hypothetical protein